MKNFLDLEISESESDSELNSDLDSESDISLSNDIDISMFKVSVELKKGKYGYGSYVTENIKIGAEIVCLCCKDCCPPENHIDIKKVHSWSEKEKKALNHAIQIDKNNICLEWNEVLGNEGLLGININPLFINYLTSE